jgi:hypothetical protein
MEKHRPIIIQEGDRVYVVKGNPVEGYRDRTGTLINGSPTKITGDSINGYRDSTGRLVHLEELTKSR